MAWTSPRTWVAGEVVTASLLNTHLRDNLLAIGSPSIPWTAPTLTNAWINFNSGVDSNAGYRLVGDRVELRGLVSSGTIGFSIFTLPAGFRPPKTVRFATFSNSALGVLVIAASDGLVNPQSGSNVSFSLDGLSFSTTA